jgi:SRSO17 transposase
MGGGLAYASRQGPALRDCARSVPPAWTNDRARCARAGSPEKQPLATKPAWARQMLTHAVDARVPAAWVTGERVYGDDRRRRGWWEERAHASVVAGSGQAYVWRGWQPPQVKTVWAPLPPDGWPRRRAGAGPKGLRWEEWRWLPLAQPLLPAWRRWL